MVHFLGPVPFDASGDEHLPDWAPALPARPTVYASLGTIFNHRPGLFAAILAGLRDEPLTFILTVGRNQEPAAFGPSQATSASSATSRRRCCCRTATSSSATAASTPSRRRWARGCRWSACRSARTSRSTPPSARPGGGAGGPTEERNPEAMRDAVRAVLGDPAYRATAERVRGEMAALPGPEYAVALLERLARDKPPLVAR